MFQSSFPASGRGPLLCLRMLPAQCLSLVIIHNAKVEYINVRQNREGSVVDVEIDGRNVTRGERIEDMGARQL